MQTLIEDAMTTHDSNDATFLSNFYPFNVVSSDGQLYVKYDPQTQLCAIIAIHSLKRGPALGGCRWLTYLSFEEALKDVTRLAKGMSYKAAMSGLPYGGGKAVLIKPNQPINQKNCLESFAQFVNSLNGNYITTIDSGLEVTDLDLIAQYTRFVTGQTQFDGKSGDPSPATALGVIRGMEAAAKYKLKRNSLEGLHVAVQGVGSVGYHLVKELRAKGAKLTVCDINAESLQQCIDEFAVNHVIPEKIYQIPCDIFSPCALGATLNQMTIPLLNTSIIAGCANNQLATPEDGIRLAKKAILYAPDYVINAGGLIIVAGQYDQTPLTVTENQITMIYDRLWEIFDRTRKNNQATNIIADQMAEQILQD